MARAALAFGADSGDVVPLAQSVVVAVCAGIVAENARAVADRGFGVPVADGSEAWIGDSSASADGIASFATSFTNTRKGGTGRCDAGVPDAGGVVETGAFVVVLVFAVVDAGARCEAWVLDPFTLGETRAVLGVEGEGARFGTGACLDVPETIGVGVAELIACVSDAACLRASVVGGPSAVQASKRGAVELVVARAGFDALILHFSTSGVVGDFLALGIVQASQVVFGSCGMSELTANLARCFSPDTDHSVDRAHCLVGSLAATTEAISGGAIPNAIFISLASTFSDGSVHGGACFGADAAEAPFAAGLAADLEVVADSAGIVVGALLDAFVGDPHAGDDVQSVGVEGLALRLGSCGVWAPVEDT